MKTKTKRMYPDLSGEDFEITSDFGWRTLADFIEKQVKKPGPFIEEKVFKLSVKKFNIDRWQWDTVAYELL